MVDLLNYVIKLLYVVLSEYIELLLPADPVPGHSVLLTFLLTSGSVREE